jgi:nucleotide-binding universal stress UspA family protein
MKNIILLPIDFQEQSILAIDYAKYFANINDFEIHLLHIIDETGVFQKFFSDKSEAGNLVKMVQSMLDDYANQLRPKYNVVTKIKTGKVYEEIENYCEEVNPTFILMGKTEKPSLRKRIVGSNTLHIVNEVKYPVISIRGDKVIVKDTGYNNILVPLDFSKPVYEQLITAVEFAKLLKSSVKIVTIYNSDSISLKTKYMTKLNKALKYMEKNNIECISELLEIQDKPIHEIITEYAVKDKSHLVIIMTRDEDSMKEFILGSNARSILETCDVPVLSVKPWDYVNEKPIFKVVFDPLNIFKED